MARLLLDQNIPRSLRNLLPGHEVRTAAELGWATLANGDLLRAAEAAGFACLLTADQSIRYQQNLTSRQIALVVLSTNDWTILRARAADIAATLRDIRPGRYVELQMPWPSRSREGEDL